MRSRHSSVGEPARERRSRQHRPPGAASSRRPAWGRQEASHPGHDVLLHRCRPCRGRRGPSGYTPAFRHTRLGDVHHPRVRRRHCTALRRADAAEPVLPHDGRLPDPGRDVAPAAAGRPDRCDPAHPRMAEESERLVQPNLQHLQLDALAACNLGELPRDTRRRPPAPERRSPPRAGRDGSSGRVRGGQSHRACADAGLLLQPLDQGARHLLVREPLHRPRARGARRRDRHVLGHQSLAPALRGGAPAADSPLADGAAAPGGGTRRSKDRALQCPLLRCDAGGGTRPFAAVREADDADHGRPRPTAGHQQHLWPPRRRRCAQGHCRDLPDAAAPLRRPGPFRR